MGLSDSTRRRGAGLGRNRTPSPGVSRAGNFQIRTVRDTFSMKGSKRGRRDSRRTNFRTKRNPRGCWLQSPEQVEIIYQRAC
ncbi:hypothetical protein M413DRAFT_282582 [Hebeloma cylindrosporum]|uniref:Uncharacterized protein n=1 Tax=Hebeloma cylindrosporum TaxID=76867 RepID=A0A0C2XG94_HEBCY|nr:hypothetical protein M413DRAFT_282582 [Hebeloma cylindrosporum h7]